MTKQDVGKLKRHDRVKVGDRLGTVVSPHEPEWIDHRTRAFRREFQGADIQFDDDPVCSYYIHFDKITIIDNETLSRREDNERSEEGVVEEECPNGCGEGLSVNYPAGREVLYCPECGWQRRLNATPCGTEVRRSAEGMVETKGEE